jgi:hypothetical protein
VVPSLYLRFGKQRVAQPAAVLAPAS